MQLVQSALSVVGAPLHDPLPFPLLLLEHATAATAAPTTAPSTIMDFIICRTSLKDPDSHLDGRRRVPHIDTFGHQRSSPTTRETAEGDGRCAWESARQKAVAEP